MNLENLEVKVEFKGGGFETIREQQDKNDLPYE